MSTRSTATATIPQPHSHYGFSHHQAYQPNVGSYGSNNALLNGPPRLPTSYKSFPANNPPSSSSTIRTAAQPSRQLPESPPMPTSQSSSTLRESRKHDRRPDWNDFYRNGPPKEIIVIDDDSPPPKPQPEDGRPNHTTRTVMGNGTSQQHANKKRKTGPSSVYGSTYNQQHSYSATQTPHYHDTPSATTISTDRTTSALHTTAATSLGSQSGGSNGAYADEGVVGQKRKRITRKQVADEAKRREIEVNGDAYSSYIPPPKPPIKAKEVFVPPVHDVRAETSLLFGADTDGLQLTLPKLQKVDDDDGHYIVIPDAELTDRCKL